MHSDLADALGVVFVEVIRVVAAGAAAAGTATALEDGANIKGDSIFSFCSTCFTFIPKPAWGLGTGTAHRFTEAFSVADISALEVEVEVELLEPPLSTFVGGNVGVGNHSTSHGVVISRRFIIPNRSTNIGSHAIVASTTKMYRRLI